MRVSETEKREWSPPKRLANATAKEAISESLIVNENGSPVIGQIIEWDKPKEDLARLRRTLRFGIKWQMSLTSQPRLSGIQAENQYFGTIPPNPTRRRYACRKARIYESLTGFPQLIDRITHAVVEPFRQHFPDAYKKHDEIVRSSIHADWLIDGEPFTSGIINNTAALPYHKDSGNLLGTWSVMLCLRDSVDGGALDIPEYDTTLAVPDESLIIFNGTEAWHAVTPFLYQRKNAYRFTLVWYVKNQIRDCVCAEQEPERAAKHATIIHDEYAANDDE